MPTKEEVDFFMNGKCGAFAIALHSRFKYPVYMAEFPADSKGNTCHFYCEKEGMQIDVRGVHTADYSSKFDALDDYEINVWLRASISEVWINRAFDIIERNVERYRA